LKPLFLESDASDYAFGTVSFLNGKDELHLVAFHLRKFMAVEINYEIHDKELLAIVDSFKEWRHFLEEAIHSVIVSTEHKNLKYFMFAWVLNRHQARWSISLSRFNFMITYCPRSQQGQSDALSRHSTTFYFLEARAITSQNPTYYNINGFNISQGYLYKSIFRSFSLEIQAIMCRF
jgi:hypothetical protein